MFHANQAHPQELPTVTSTRNLGYIALLAVGPWRATEGDEAALSCDHYDTNRLQHLLYLKLSAPDAGVFVTIARQCGGLEDHKHRSEFAHDPQNQPVRRQTCKVSDRDRYAWSRESAPSSYINLKTNSRCELSQYWPKLLSAWRRKFVTAGAFCRRRVDDRELLPFALATPPSGTSPLLRVLLFMIRLRSPLMRLIASNAHAEVVVSHALCPVIV
ncbi:hypothetical protein EVAR_33121_1 [Eumeta japonica]|uniref:Uncharacterized protein n=1 Tax=Eumeta variegata TaxID=151549 RepID=A0A4C1Y736_EUMVA|nr:hypothetical protein EVAR_33121_1 [Eumeta japonica]